MAVLKVFRGGLPIAEVDVPPGGLSIGSREGDDLRLPSLGVESGDEEGGRLSSSTAGWSFASRRGDAPTLLPPGGTWSIGDACLEVLGGPVERVLDVSSLAPGGTPLRQAEEDSGVAAQRLQALAEAIDVSGREGEPASLEDVLSRALGLSGASRAFLGVVEPNGKDLRVVASVGLEGRDPRSQVSRSVVEAVLREGREVVTGDASREIPTSSVALLGLRTICACPVRVGGRVAGIAYADAGAVAARSAPSPLLAYLRALGALLARHLADEERRREEAEAGRAASGRARDLPGDEEIAWVSPAMRRLRDEAERIARALESRALPVLLTGETGSGKEVLARLLHALASRGRGRFVPVNCAAIPKDLAESELFGIEQGVATGVLRRIGRFQQADGGTLFLDEVGEMDPAVQGKVLRAIETRRIQRVGSRDEVPIDVRVLSATNAPLADAIRAGRFREDLYWRLCGVEMRVPALRERSEDVPVLASAFVRRFAREYGSPVESISPAALARLAAHSWPGNVRELRQRIGAMVVLASGKTIEAEDVARNLARGDGVAPAAASDRDPALRSIEEVEREHVERVMARVGGDAGRAAEILGVHPKTLRRWLKAPTESAG